jgi:hypothetical protein
MSMGVRYSIKTGEKTIREPENAGRPSPGDPEKSCRRIPADDRKGPFFFVIVEAVSKHRF